MDRRERQPKRKVKKRNFLNAEDGDKFSPPSVAAAAASAPFSAAVVVD
jgi:hypothetical protein